MYRVGRPNIVNEECREEQPPGYRMRFQEMSPERMNSPEYVVNENAVYSKQSSEQNFQNVDDQTLNAVEVVPVKRE
jgi:hypothetical protein